MLRHRSFLIAFLAVAAVGIFIAFARTPVHRLPIKCYFKDAQGLRPGATVRLAGVNIGSVRSVRARPELRDHPAEVDMVLETSYELHIPSDAVVTLERAGVLGDVFPEINVQNASGPPVREGDTLATRASDNPDAQQWLEHVAGQLQKKGCGDVHKQAPASPARK